MKIVADSNIPFAAEACAYLGEVEVLKAKDFSPERLRDCEVLLCRSTRKINAELLDGTAVRLVATATIGTDHIDFDYLAGRGIQWASAPGSNANSVSEYITSALLVLAKQLGKRLREMTLGVVGVGNVGSRVVKKAQALGMTVLQNDPPLARATGDARYRPLAELAEVDAITFHVPLTREGEDATYHMVNASLLSRFRPGLIFFNSSRGAVVDEQALHEAISKNRFGAVGLDVWEHEPVIDGSLLDRVQIGTPHIAGHSFDGKVNGTKMVYDAACRFAGVEPQWNPSGALPTPDVPELSLDAAGRDDEDVIREAVLALYDVRRDDADLRKAPRDETFGEHFSSLRRNYWRRRAFHHTAIHLANGSDSLMAKLAGLGFQV
jgi:erythronate-4-phosphate dehydrogenase